MAARAAGLRCAMLTTSHPAEELSDGDLVWTDLAGHTPSRTAVAALSTTIDRERLHLLRDGALVVHWPAAIFEVTGPGALTCLQGLLTNDLDKPGDGRWSTARCSPRKARSSSTSGCCGLGDRFLLRGRSRRPRRRRSICSGARCHRGCQGAGSHRSYAALRLLGTDAGGRVAAAGLAGDSGAGPERGRHDGLVLRGRISRRPSQGVLIGPTEAIADAREQVAAGAAPTGHS